MKFVIVLTLFILLAYSNQKKLGKITSFRFKQDDDFYNPNLGVFYS